MEVNPSKTSSCLPASSQSVAVLAVSKHPPRVVRVCGKHSQHTHNGVMFTQQEGN